MRVPPFVRSQEHKIIATFRQWIGCGKRSQSLWLPTRSVARARSGGGLGSAPHTAIRCGTAAIAAGEKNTASATALSCPHTRRPRVCRVLRKRQAPSGQPAAPSASAKCSRMMGTWHASTSASHSKARYHNPEVIVRRSWPSPAAFLMTKPQHDSTPLEVSPTHTGTWDRTSTACQFARA